MLLNQQGLEAGSTDPCFVHIQICHVNKSFMPGSRYNAAEMDPMQPASPHTLDTKKITLKF